MLRITTYVYLHVQYLMCAKHTHTIECTALHISVQLFTYKGLHSLEKLLQFLKEEGLLTVQHNSQVVIWHFSYYVDSNVMKFFCYTVTVYLTPINKIHISPGSTLMHSWENVHV